jgi:hypothetical protein
MNQFDWWRFGVRGFFGGIFGALIGWRFWIRFCSEQNWQSLLVWAAGGFILVGTIVGLSKPRDFWRRP